MCARIVLRALPCIAVPATGLAQDATSFRPQQVADLSYALDEDFPWTEALGAFAFSERPSDGSSALRRSARMAAAPARPADLTRGGRPQ